MINQTFHPSTGWKSRVFWPAIHPAGEDPWIVVEPAARRPARPARPADQRLVARNPRRYWLWPTSPTWPTCQVIC